MRLGHSRCLPDARRSLELLDTSVRAAATHISAGDSDSGKHSSAGLEREVWSPPEWMKGKGGVWGLGRILQDVRIFRTSPIPIGFRD